MIGLANNDSVLKKIEELEKSFNTRNFNKKYFIFFDEACCHFDIPDFVIKKILKINDPLINHNIIIEYLSFYQLNMSVGQFKCFEITKEATKKRYAKKSLCVEPLESFGTNNCLPAKEIYNSLSAYTFINNNPYLLTITREGFFSQEKDEFYSEQKWADKETSILIALINLSIEFGWCDFFMSDNSFYVPLGLCDYNVRVLNQKSIKRINETIELYEYVHKKVSKSKNEPQRNFIYKRDININKIKSLNKKIDRKNAVLVRCLYYFAKACAYTSHRMMMEESTALQLFCLDGLSKLLMKKYKIKKIQNLGTFLLKEFNCPYGEYLKELHDERTIYVHPSNIHGEYWCPPWDADTCYDTLPVVKDLMLIYLLEEFKESR